ncbi:MAG: hypothetical protein FWD71_03260 [Oscillospiraceae bacterium]|nr:hypothetical protein [Oscillospiraceae bacterium]
MFGCNQDITLWRRKKDLSTKKEIFAKVDIPVKCMWKSRHESHINGTGESLPDRIVVIIPYYEGLSVNLGDILECGIDKITVSAVEYNLSGYGRHLRVEGR